MWVGPNCLLLLASEGNIMLCYNYASEANPVSAYGSGEHRVGDRPTAPPGPDDEAALEHAQRLQALGADRTDSGLLRDLAYGWIALCGGKGGT